MVKPLGLVEKLGIWHFDLLCCPDSEYIRIQLVKTSCVFRATKPYLAKHPYFTVIYIILLYFFQIKKKPVKNQFRLKFIFSLMDYRLKQLKLVQMEFLDLYLHYLKQMPHFTETMTTYVGYLIRDMVDGFEQEVDGRDVTNPYLVRSSIYSHAHY